MHMSRDLSVILRSVLTPWVFKEWLPLSWWPGRIATKGSQRCNQVASRWFYTPLVYLSTSYFLGHLHSQFLSTSSLSQFPSSCAPRAFHSWSWTINYLGTLGARHQCSLSDANPKSLKNLLQSGHLHRYQTWKIWSKEIFLGLRTLWI